MIREENIRLIFGLKVRMRRQERKFSLSELAKKADMSVSYLNEIEKGKKYPKRTKIASLADALETTYDELVSLKISKKLGVLSNLLTSNILHELPLDVFGLEPRNLLELMSDAPAKLSAFVNTIIEISRNYDLTVENFYFSVLRSYQEMHDNYFEEIEKEADLFREEILKDDADAEELIKRYLTEEFGYELDFDTLSEDKVLYTFRSILKEEKGKPKILMVNSKLNKRQRTFILAREVGFNRMQIKERSNTYSWIRARSFDELLNDYKATYFAGAVLVPEKELVEDMDNFLGMEEFNPDYFIKLIQKHNVSPETFVHRMTSILPRHFWLNKLFFLKLNHKLGSNKFELTKELHLDGLHSPHGTVLSEHYCRRWVSLKIFQQLADQKYEGTFQNTICSAQVSKYITSGKEYFCITLARPSSSLADQGTDESITIGFYMNEGFKERCNFWKSEKVNVELVNETCERCPASDCSVRAADAMVLKKEKNEKEISNALESLLGVNYSTERGF